MVWADISYGQRTQVHSINGNLNAQPHVARIYTQLLEAENIPILAWPAYSPDMSPIERVWDALERVPIPVIIPQLSTAI